MVNLVGKLKDSNYDSLSWFSGKKSNNCCLLEIVNTNLNCFSDLNNK